MAALEQWPQEGVPENPGAWLMGTAKHKALDRLRPAKMLERKEEEIARELETSEEPDLAAQADDDIGDELLSLMFTACHPVLSTEARVALTLRLIGGADHRRRSPALSWCARRRWRSGSYARRGRWQRRGCRSRCPRGAERAERLESVLEVVYVIFNEGYAASAGDDWMRAELCEDALRLGRILAGLAPREPEVLGLVALMELQASRSRARTGPDGQPILLLDQDRARWDQLLIRRGLAASSGPWRLGGALGPYGLQAAIAACHARARRAEDTDWQQIAALYDALAEINPSPVVELIARWRSEWPTGRRPGWSWSTGW